MEESEDDGLKSDFEISIRLILESTCTQVYTAIHQIWLPIKLNNLIPVQKIIEPKKMFGRIKTNLVSR